MSTVDAKIVKQIEYYFGDVNLAKDKHLKQLISAATDGWVSYEEMLKFPRLKQITEDKEVIKVAIQQSESKVVEANDDGIRRNPELAIPEDLLAIAEIHLDKSLYIKGFKTDETIDEIIDYLEKFGGPTLNVHMRKIPKSKAFKGSVFAIFKEKEDAEKLLNNEDASLLKGNAMTRMWQSEYNSAKKTEFDERHKERDERQKATKASREALVENKMTKGALIELSGFDVKVEDATETGDFSNDRETRTATKNLKTWLTEKLAEVAPVSWVEHFPATSKVIVRLGKEDAAQEALDKLVEGKERTFSYQAYLVKGEVLSGEPERDYWRNIVLQQANRGQKRGGSRGGRGGHGDRKRQRR